LPRHDTLQRFEQAALPHTAAAYNLARWLTGKHEDAEDVVQEAFLRAYASFDSLRGDDVRPWLLTIVRHTAYTWLKRNRAGAPAEELDDNFADSRAPAADPETLLLASADASRVRAAVAKLPPDFRAAIVLREFEELSYKEIAAVTGAPMGTVMSRLTRARESLKRLLTAPSKGDRPQ
jgi:RNA polymerase sigma-70 factor (ECF subfamily)